MQHCVDCAHFEQRSADDSAFEVSDDQRGAYESWGRCNMTTSDADGDDDAGVALADNRPRISDTRAYAQDHDCYRAWLMVRVDFGCVQFAERQG